MGGWLLLSLVLAVAAAAIPAPGLLLVAAATAAYGALSRLWTRFGIQRVGYERSLSSRRAVTGDNLTLDVTVWNRKPLPLPWIAADDLITDGLEVRERPELERDTDTGERRILHNAWALAWFERVVRHFHLDAVRRGVYDFGPVRVAVRDILGRDAAGEELELRDRLVVAPRTLPLSTPGVEASPIGERRARRSLHADPALYAGVRPYVPGDSRRQVHWRASARLGALVSRRFEPARGRQVVIALDVQTLAGQEWEMTYDEPSFEEMCIIAASLARRLLADGASVGLAAASFTKTPQRIAWLPPQATSTQVSRIAELLARFGPISSGPFGTLLTWLTRRVPPGTVVIVLSARDPEPFLAALRRLAANGYEVLHIAAGLDAKRHAGAARRVGLMATTATLSPDWEHADAVVLAG